MTRVLAVVLLTMFSQWVAAQSNNSINATTKFQSRVPQSITPESYSNSQMLDMGLTASDIAQYQSQRETVKGLWWGHMSPVEFLMYSSEDENERKRFAKLYLSSNLPKAVAERDAMVTMYEMAREVYAEQYGLVSNDESKRPALFVNIACSDCSDEVVDIINLSQIKVDVYLTGLTALSDENEKQQAMINWARELNIHPKKITLNDDNGIYEQLNHQPLVSYHLMDP